jgi:DNA-binding NarL/FixJ family response regulator
VSEFDVARIVPAMRDLFGALATRRQSLALIPALDSADGGSISREASRLDGIDVRAFARSAADGGMLELARSTSAIPTLCTASMQASEDCQRARFFGADGVVIQAQDATHFEHLRKTAQSMRMMAIAEVTDAETATRLIEAGTRALFLRAESFEQLDALVEQAQGAAVLIAEGARTADELRALSGRVDAAIVPAAIHTGASFKDLQGQLDG